MGALGTALGALGVLAAGAVLGTATLGPATLTTPAAASVSRVHVEPLVTFALPPTSSGCAGATTLAGGATSVPITVSTVAGQVAESLNVCIGDRGPYPFYLDSGAGQTVIDAGLAARLHLAAQGAVGQFEGVGCTGRAQLVRVAAWSVAGLPLGAQTLVSSTLPGMGGPGQAVGLLGSDVLSRFGAVRVDFSAQTLTVPGPEGPTPSVATVRGPRGPVPPAVLTAGPGATVVPVSVTMTPGDVALNVRVRLGGGAPRLFTVDTGSSQSIVATSVARRVHLAHTDLAQRQQTVCSTITSPLVRSGTWSIPGIRLRPQLLATSDFGSIGAGGLVGLLGSDQLQRYGWVVFDYRGGRLVVGRPLN